MECSNDVLNDAFVRCVFEQHDVACHLCATRKNRLGDLGCHLPNGEKGHPVVQSEPGVVCGKRLRGVTVSTLDSESSDRGSNPREVSRQILKNELKRECNIVLDSTIASLQCVFWATTYPLRALGAVCGEEALGTNDTPLRRPVSLKAPCEIST